MRVARAWAAAGLTACLLAAVPPGPPASASVPATTATTAAPGPAAPYGWTVTRVDPVTGRPTITHASTRPAADRLAYRLAETSSGPSSARSARVVVEPDGPPPVPTAVRSAARSNDAMRGQLWWLSRLQAEKIWPRHDGGRLVVAVIDSGLDTTDPDLKGLAVTGHNMFDGSSVVTPDVLGHGTAVTSVIAAKANNGHGTAGLAQHVRIMPVKIFSDEAKTGETGAMLGGAITWAVDHGARVVNLSLGGPAMSRSTKAALDYATAQDVVVVASSGNEGRAGSPVHYPGAYPPVLAVGAIGPDGQVADFSTTGPGVDVVSAGASMRVLLPGAGHSDVWQGTSFSAPLVSALAALLRVQHPSWSAAKVVARIQDTAADFGPLGKDPDSGWGEMDARMALDGVCSIRCGAAKGPALPTTRPTVKDGITIRLPYFLGRGHVAVGTIEVRSAGTPVPGVSVRWCVTQSARAQVCRTQVTGPAGSFPVQLIMSSPPVVVDASATVTGTPRTASVTVLDGLPVTIRTTSTSIIAMAPSGSGQTASLWQWTGEAWVHVTPDKVLLAGRSVTWPGLPTGGVFRLDVAAGGGLPARSIHSIWTFGA